MQQGRKRHTPVAAFILAVMTVVAFRGVSEGAGNGNEPPHVGIVVALTGYLAGIDGPYIDGVKLAVNRIIASGGGAGPPIPLHIVDGASTAATGVTVANQLLNQYEDRSGQQTVPSPLVFAQVHGASPAFVYATK